MGDDGDQFQYYLPLLRRMIILAAVLAAVPVILWTITAFMRTYVGPPKAPTFRPIAASSTTDTATTASVAPDTGGQPISLTPQAAASDQQNSTIVEARATMKDARSVPSAAKGPFLGDHAPDAGAAQPTAALTGTTPTGAEAETAPVPADTDAPSGVTATGALATQAPADSEPQADADALPAVEPLADPVPLPRHRPRYFAMVDVPMPRARPEGAGPKAGAAGPLDWLQKIFQPQQQTQQQ
jgi:hypothetical protein